MYYFFAHTMYKTTQAGDWLLRLNDILPAVRQKLTKATEAADAAKKEAAGLKGNLQKVMDVVNGELASKQGECHEGRILAK